MQKEITEDNARKFISEKISQDFLNNHQATHFELIVDWLKTEEHNEQKLAYKKFPDESVQILLISKVTQNGNRLSEKEKILENEYLEKLTSSILHLEKTRYEFNYEQDGVTFNLKYDEFENGKLNLLEVDGLTEDDRNKFNPQEFPFVLTEVSGDNNYSGYKILNVINS